VPSAPILFVSHVADVGGAEAVLLDVLGALDRTRFAPQLACPAGGNLPARAAALGVPVHDLPFAGGRPLGKALGAILAARRLRRLAAQLGIGTVVATSMIAGYAAALARHRRLTPVWHLHIVTTHPLARFAARRMALVITPSQAGLSAIDPHGRLGERGRVLPNGVADRFFAAPPATDLRQRLGISGAAPLVGIVGRLDPHKGHDVLFAALARLPDVHLAVLGGALFTAAQPRLRGEAERLRALVDSLGLSPRVHWLGEVADTAPFFGALDVLAVPSTAVESAPRTIAEAQAAGCAVVASRIGGIPELIDDGRTGLLVPPGDAAALAAALGGLITSPERRAALVAAACAAAGRDYRLGTAAEHFGEALAAVVGTRPARVSPGRPGSTRS
jgi:glycosyltransferase involved in cell wall biosynthesis